MLSAVFNIASLVASVMVLPNLDSADTIPHSGDIYPATTPSTPVALSVDV
jgi:hypothetical protein